MKFLKYRIHFVLLSYMSVSISMCCAAYNSKNALGDNKHDINEYQQSIRDVLSQYKSIPHRSQNEQCFLINDPTCPVTFKLPIEGNFKKYLILLSQDQVTRKSSMPLKAQILTGIPLGMVQINHKLYLWNGNDFLIDQATNIAYDTPFMQLNTLKETTVHIPRDLSKSVIDIHSKNHYDQENIKETYKELIDFWEKKYNQ